jgi:antitoxin component of MazEF toxin-antitoxin module
VATWEKRCVYRALERYIEWRW